jgi:hypothetical protein
VTWKRVERTWTMPLRATRVMRTPSQPTGGIRVPSGPWRFSFRGRLPGLQRCDPAGQALVRTLGVVDDVEPVDLFLQLFEGGGDGLLVEPAEQGLVEALVLALRGRLVGLAGDRLDAECGDVGDELPDNTASGRVQRDPVVAEQPLRDPVRGDGLLHHRDRMLPPRRPWSIQ